MTYSSDFLLFYAYAVAAFAALLVSVVTLTLEAVTGSVRQWRRKRLGRGDEPTKRRNDAVVRTT